MGNFHQFTDNGIANIKIARMAVAADLLLRLVELDADTAVNGLRVQLRATWPGR